MKAPALGEAAAHLPWLSPGAAALIALVQQPADAWSVVRADVGCLFLSLRYTSAAHTTSATCNYSVLLRESSLFEAAARHLAETGPGFVAWSETPARALREAGLTYGRTAAALAERSGDCDPEQAWVAGLLAPLGWYALAALAPADVAACLAEPMFLVHPRELPRQRWGLSPDAVARRLARRWRLPRWLAAAVGYLDLPVATAETLGADPGLFRVLQTAIGLVQQRGALPLLPCPAVDGSVDVDLGDDNSTTDDDADPRSLPLLPDLLRLAAENQKLHNAPVLRALEHDMDRLQQALQEQYAGERCRLQAQKLRALAEFAAGAGHEINNPLAVISGQAQYLLNQENEPGRQRCLQKIIGQAQRIHHILQELMQFARPARPRLESVDVHSVVQGVLFDVTELATQRHVQLQCRASETPLQIQADPRQVATALTCLLRNAIEAAPCDGWALVRVESEREQVLLVVEDNGPGPAPAQQEHLFDPFYSGRLAGRGRGLGLPTAWRLAQENGGDVRFEPVPGGPTRFVLSFPQHAAAAPSTLSASEPRPPLSAAS